MNPYVPWNLSPTGAMIGPLALLAMFYRRKKSKRSAFEPYLFLLVLALLILSVGLACKIGTPAPATLAPTPTMPPAQTPTPSNPPATNTGGAATQAPSSPTPVPTKTDPCADGHCTPTPTPTPKNWLPVQYQITHYVVVLESDSYFSSSYIANIPFWENGQNKYYPYNYAFIVGSSDADKDKNWSVYVQGTGKAKDGKYIATDQDPAHFPPDFDQHAVYQYVSQPQAKCGTWTARR